MREMVQELGRRYWGRGWGRYTSQFEGVARILSCCRTLVTAEGFSKTAPFAHLRPLESLYLRHMIPLTRKAILGKATRKSLGWPSRSENLGMRKQISRFSEVCFESLHDLVATPKYSGCGLFRMRRAI